MLNGGNVSALADGVRVERATSANDPSKVQNVYFAMGARTRWSWTLAALHPVTSWRIEEAGRTTVSGNSGTTESFGTGTGRTRVAVNFSPAQKYTSGFAYGTDTSAPLGNTSPTSYLYSAATNGTSARPFASLYLRPTLSSTQVFDRIGDGGTAPVERTRVADYRSAYQTWGVAGLAKPTPGEGHVQVQSFAQQGSTMFVGGNFATVQQTKNAPADQHVAQPYLAAFHQKTGEFLPGFRPTLDGEVRGIAALPNNKIAIVGAFRTVNGVPNTGVVVLNAADGSVDPTFSLTLQNRVSGSTLILRAVSYKNGFLYLGGSFTHGAGGGSPYFVYARNALRMNATTGKPDGTWNPSFNGTVMALDPAEDHSRVYLAGFFTTSQGASANRAAAVQTAGGAPLAMPGWSPTWSMPSPKNYQQAINQVGDAVWVGGAQHSMFSFSTTTFERLSTSVGDDGGDVQTISSGPGVAYAGCHCNYDWYDGATTYPIGGPWTNADQMSWIGAWDLTSRRIIPDFNPVMSTSNGGPWASIVDSDNTLWVGGDITSTRYTANSTQWSGGFARFPETDHTAPSTPTVTSAVAGATTVTLSWTASDDASWPITYQILRDDRVVAVTRNRTLTVPAGGENRFFVRAADPNGNLSASTPVRTVAAPDPQPAEVP